MTATHGIFRPSELAETMALLYEAALEPAVWPRFLEAYSRMLGGQCALMWSYDYANSSAGISDEGDQFPSSSVGFDPDRLADFGRHYIKTNVWAPRTRDIPEGLPVVSSAIYPESELVGTEFYNDWLRPQGLRYALGGAACNRGTQSLRITTLREERRGPFEPQTLEIHRLLSQHIKRAYALHTQVRTICDKADLSHATLDRFSTAVCLIGESKRLCFANAAARDLGRVRDGIWIGPDGGIRATDSAVAHRLSHAVSIALVVGRHATSSQCCGDIAVTRRGEKGPLLVSVYPLGARSPFGVSTAAAVFIAEPDARRVCRADALRVQFGLTQAEARLAEALANGSSLSDHAAANEISKNTVRTHLRRLLNKCGARSQADLVRLVSAAGASR